MGHVPRNTDLLRFASMSYEAGASVVRWRAVIRGWALKVSGPTGVGQKVPAKLHVCHRQLGSYCDFKVRHSGFSFGFPAAMAALREFTLR